MPYLGNNLQAAFPSYTNIDDISSSFNGTLKTFPLNVSGSTPVPFPVNPQQCLISVNGVIQKPDSTGVSGFNLVGSNIVFASAPTSGWAFFGVVLAGADYINIGAKFPDGAENTPSMTFENGLTTGLYLAGANQLGIVSNGTRRILVDANGRVGVGTGSPAARLDVSGSYAANFTAVAALDLDLSTANYFTKTISTSSSFTFSNTPTTRAFAFVLELNQTSGSVTWPAAVIWPAGIPPTLTTGKRHLFIFATSDGGTTWRSSSLINYAS